ncbi:MAG: hypothetical protein IT371_28575 [Deltaproteobacteria bacterium]|nr:hypothetical protein [Deltaproteobacteria bacterium]
MLACPGMTVALVTCRDWPLLTDDDRLLQRALGRRGVATEPVLWDEPSIDWSRYAVSLIRSTWDYVRRLPDYLAWAERAGARTRLENSASLVRWNTHKAYLATLAERGVPVVPTVWLPAGAPAKLGPLLAAQGWPAGVLKPVVSAGAWETVRVDAHEVASGQAHLDRLLPGHELMLQPYLDSVAAEGELSAIFFDGAPSHAVRKLPAGGDFRVQPQHGGRVVPCPLDGELRAAGGRVLEALESSPLYARVDLLRDADGVLRLVELELVEPFLYFEGSGGAEERLADLLVQRVAETEPGQ